MNAQRKLAEYRRGCVVVLHGPATLDVTLAGTRFAVSPNAFFQTNTAAANLLVSHVISAATQGMTDSELQAAVSSKPHFALGLDGLFQW